MKSATVAIDVSGRPFLVFPDRVPGGHIRPIQHATRARVFPGLRDERGDHLHVETPYGFNAHHIAESCFEGLARALRLAVEVDPRQQGQVPSTKGTLSG